MAQILLSPSALGAWPPFAASEQGVGRGLRVVVASDRVAGRARAVGWLMGDPLVGEVLPAADAEATLHLLARHEVDVIFIEVDLPGLGGLDLARTLQRLANAPAVVLLADKPDRALDAFEVGALDYLVTPVLPARIAQSLERARSRFLARRSRIARDPGRAEPATALPPLVSRPDASPDLRPSEVSWISAERDYVRVPTVAGSHLVNLPLGLLVNSWADAGIIRIHRSYAVRADAVSEMRRGARGYSVRGPVRVLQAQRGR